MKDQTLPRDAEVLSVETNPPRRGGARLPVALALLLALAAVAASAWHWLELQDLRAGMRRLEAADAALGGRPDLNADPRVPAALRDIGAGAERIAALETRLDRSVEETAALRAALEALGSTDRRDWALAEAEYLERLASQSLLMGREARGALALLQAADETLHALDDPSLHEARAALARDIASLRAVAQFDVEGVYLRLSALSGQVPSLVLLDRSRAAALGGAASGRDAAVADNWWSRMLAVLDRYVVVRERATPLKPLLPLAEEEYLRMNLRLGLEQAKLGLLAAEPAVYRGALAEVRQLVGGWMSATAAVNQAFVAEAGELAAVEIAPVLPDISGSLRALRERSGLAVPAERDSAPGGP